MEQATQKQIEFAKKLGIENPEKYDKQALRGLIDVKVQEQPKKVSQDSSKGEYNSNKNQIREYHLTPEQIRTNACDLALNACDLALKNGITPENPTFWTLVDEFYNYLTA